jgi:hypothetical protein
MDFFHSQQGRGQRMARFGIAWHGIAWHGTAWIFFSLPAGAWLRLGMALYGAVRLATVGRGMAWIFFNV